MSPIQPNPPPLSISIGIPASFIDIHSNLLHKTLQISRIARAAAIFQVDEILVYKDYPRRKQSQQRRLITTILQYLETPQYLRKHLFGKIPELRYAGLLPPLRTPHHPIEKTIHSLKNGEMREGYAFTKAGNNLIDVGVEKPLPLMNPPHENIPGRHTARIKKIKSKVVAYFLPSPDPGIYWGFKVIDTQQSLGEFLTKNPIYGLILATSRKGQPLEQIWSTLQRRWQQVGRLLLLFGSHKEGLNEILQREGCQLSDITEYSVNMIPKQGVATVRTEEAVFISLALSRNLEIRKVNH